MRPAMLRAVLASLATFVCCVCAEQSFESAKASTPREIYDKGVESYLVNDFDGCIQSLEAAVKRYKKLTQKLQYCRLLCHEESSTDPALHNDDVEHLRFFEQTIKNTLCLLKCKKRELREFDGHQPDAETQTLFAQRKPYQYLYVCYAHNKEIQKAANAAFTYLVMNPNDIGVSKAFDYFIQQPDVDHNEIINYEANDYVHFYEQGAQSYSAKQWESVINNMEASLASFLRSVDECRVQCEDSFEHGWMPDFIPAIANHFTHVLLCKRKCCEHLSTLNGAKHDDLLPSHYHYLQYAYFKAGQLKEACQAATSYLLWFPTDKTMSHNVEYYKTLPNVVDDYFKPRAEAQKYMRRHIYEEKIFKYIRDVFAIEAQNGDEDKFPWINQSKLLIAKLAQKRFARDHVITLDQCQRLVEIANNYSVAGDGYMTGSTSPHTIHEDYAGLSLKRASTLLHSQKLSWTNLNLLLRVTNDIKSILESQFNVIRRLHFSYTHLVCRSAKQSEPRTNRTDFSHSVHADNCNIQENGSCPKDWPAFTWRDFTAIVYLNSDFSGGELFFSTDVYGNIVEEAISPQCGRLVGFTSGEENLHGVTAIQEGSRCALAVWFTYDRNNKERERDEIVEFVDDFD